MLFKTEGIVLHVIRYRETSVIVEIFTELFGMQSYIVNGVRTAKAKSAKANILQPAHILDLVVYHNERKNLQRISEFKPAYIYQKLYGNIIKNTIGLYLVELLHKCLSEPEAHPHLYRFSRECLIWMDKQPSFNLTNLPLYFTLKIAGFLGFEIYGTCNEQNPFLDFQEGEFVEKQPLSLYLKGKEAGYTYQLLKVKDKNGLSEIKIPQQIREYLLSSYLDFLKLHLPGYRDLRSPKILKSILH